MSRRYSKFKYPITDTQAMRLYNAQTSHLHRDATVAIMETRNPETVRALCQDTPPNKWGVLNPQFRTTAKYVNNIPET